MIYQIPIRAATAAAPSRLVSTHAVRAPFSPCFTTTTTTTTISTTRHLTTEARFTPQASSSPSLRPSPTPSTATASPSGTPKRLTYLVERTASKNLPVYDDVRSGGTRKQTLIKKIVGNTQDLKSDIIEELKFKKEDVKINPVTGQVVIKGFHHEKVKNWLEARGF